MLYEQKITAAEAGEELQHYYNIIKSVNGTMYTVWHNSFLGSDPEFSGWREVYESFVASVKE